MTTAKPAQATDDVAADLAAWHDFCKCTVDHQHDPRCDGWRCVEQEAAIRAALTAGKAVPSADKETIETLLELLNPLHGALDKQLLDRNDAHPDGRLPDEEIDVLITAQQERDLTQAVLILENRLHDPQITPGKAVPGEERAAALEEAAKLAESSRTGSQIGPLYDAVFYAATSFVAERIRALLSQRPRQEGEGK